MLLWQLFKQTHKISQYEPPHDKTNKMVCEPSEDSDQPGHYPNLIRIFAVRMKKTRVLSYQFVAQRRLWSDWADAQADLSSWAQRHFVGFVMRWLIFALSIMFENLGHIALFDPICVKQVLSTLCDYWALPDYMLSVPTNHWDSLSSAKWMQ